MAEAPQSPLFAHEEPGPRFTIKHLSRALATTGIAYSAANARIAAYAKNRLIHVRGKGEGPTSPNKYAVADMAAAMMLSAIQDAGIADQRVLSAASEALYAWTPGAARTTNHPILAAVLETFTSAAMWQLQIDIYWHAQTGGRSVVASFYRSGEIDPNTAPPESDAVKRLRVLHRNVRIEPDPRTDDENLPVATIQIPAFFRLHLLRPIVAPTGN